MPDQTILPARVSPLLQRSGEHIVDYKNLRLSERKALSAIQVLSFKGKHESAATAIGDDRLQKQAGGRVVPDSFTHGTSAQRVAWFRHGFRTGRFSEGNTFDDAIYRRVNPR